MNTKEKRKFERIPNDDLPVIFKNLLVDIGEHKNLNAETVDVSTTGIGVHLSLPSGILDRIDQVVLHSADNRYKFSGQIVNVMKLREDYYRLGVVLKDSQ
jgi:exoribonuclease II